MTDVIDGQYEVDRDVEHGQEVDFPGQHETPATGYLTGGGNTAEDTTEVYTHLNRAADFTLQLGEGTNGPIPQGGLRGRNPVDEEAAANELPSNLERHTKAELLDLADARGLDVTETNTKAEIIAALEADDEA